MGLYQLRGKLGKEHHHSREQRGATWEKSRRMGHFCQAVVRSQGWGLSQPQLSVPSVRSACTMVGVWPSAAWSLSILVTLHPAAHLPWAAARGSSTNMMWMSQAPFCCKKELVLCRFRAHEISRKQQKSFSWQLAVAC